LLLVGWLVTALLLLAANNDDGGNNNNNNKNNNNTNNKQRQAEKKDQLAVDAEKSLRAHADDVWDDKDYEPWLVVELPCFRIPIISSEKPCVRGGRGRGRAGTRRFITRWLTH
jgi:hypothetical protein